MDKMRCYYGGMEVSAHIYADLPVECPSCGAIRKIAGKSGWIEEFKYPAHHQADMVRMRRRWKRVDGVWKIVDAN